MLDVVKVKVNGETYYKGKHFEKVHIVNPTPDEPFWLIGFYTDGEPVKWIRATGEVTIIEEKK